MKRFSKIVLYVLAIGVLSWFLPWLYALCFPAHSGDPFATFSPVSGKWIISQSRPGEKTVILEVDSANSVAGSFVGTEITREQRDSLVPQFFYKELLAHDKLPDSIGGKEVSVHSLRTHEYMLTRSPRDVVKRFPGVWLMMESLPERVELSDADQVFRFTPEGTIEFVAMADNSVREKRSRRFTGEMHRQGFVFPAVDLSANVTSRKQYDEGYLMIDSDGKPFHIKQQAGRPYVRRISMPEGRKAVKVEIIEETNRDVMGFVVDNQGDAYMLERNDYALMPLPVGKVDPSSESLLIMGNLFNTVFRFSGPDGTRWRAVERGSDGYQLLGELNRKTARSTASQVADYVFPYVLSFVSTADSLAYPRLSRWSAKALILNAVLAIAVLFINHKRGRRSWLAPVSVVPFGIYSFIPFLALND